MSARVNPMPGQRLHIVEDWEDYDAAASLRETDDLDQAHIITSLSESGKHKIVLDIDFPAQLIPSSTEGHFHLYIDHEIEWPQYQELLAVLAEAGVLQKGYVSASEQRGFTAVRLPWVKKSDMPPSPRCVRCHKGPASFEEYRRLALEEGYTSPAEAVRHEEGTFNPENGHFYCTRCYIAAGQPLGVAA